MRSVRTAPRRTYSEPASTCSAQSRRKSAAKPTRRSAAEDPDAPRELRREAIRLDARFGSGSGGRQRGRPVGVLAKELTSAASRRGARPEQPAHEPVDRRGQDQVEDDRRATGLAETGSAGARSPRTKCTTRSAERVEDRHDRDREVRRVRTVAAGRLAVTADPVAGEREDERREPEQPSVAVSRSRPPEKPPTARHAPRSSATATSVTSTRSGSPPNTPTWERSRPGGSPRRTTAPRP